jgi:hypothetical protein
VPLFVLDPAVLGAGYGRSADRRRFLAQSLSDLDASLEELGSSVVVRRHVPELATLGRPRVGHSRLDDQPRGRGLGSRSGDGAEDRGESRETPLPGPLPLATLVD